jgi:hypothetical protein
MNHKCKLTSHIYIYIYRNISKINNFLKEGKSRDISVGIATELRAGRLGF